MAAPDDGTAATGPAYVIVARGHTPRGWPWYLVRKRGGQLARVTVHGAQATAEGTLEAIEAALAALPPRPPPNCF